MTTDVIPQNLFNAKCLAWTEDRSLQVNSISVPRHLPIAHLPIRLLSSDFYPSHFYPSRLLPITGLSSKKDFYPSGHSPIRTFTHLFYFKHHKQRSIRRKLNPSLSLNKKLFSHRHLPWTMLGTYCQTYVVFHSHALSEGLHKAMIIWRFQDPKPQFEAMQLFKVSLYVCLVIPHQVLGQSPCTSGASW